MKRELGADPEDVGAMMPILLRTSLLAAVPLWVAEYRRLTPGQLQAIASECAAVVGEKGDVLMYGSGKSKKERGSAAGCFNALAKGLACAVLLVGEVKWLDMHFTRESMGCVTDTGPKEPTA